MDVSDASTIESKGLTNLNSTHVRSGNVGAEVAGLVHASVPAARARLFTNMASAPPAPTAGSNWLSEWQARTPVVSRFALYITLPVTVLGLLVPTLGIWMSLTPEALTRGQLWRFITAVPYQGGLLALIFVVLMLVTQAPHLESELGSLRFLTRASSWGLLINVVWAGLTVRVVVSGGLPCARARWCRTQRTCRTEQQ